MIVTAIDMRCPDRWIHGWHKDVAGALTEELTNRLYHSGTHCRAWNCAYGFGMSLRLCLSPSRRKTSGERIAENGANYYHLVYKVTAGLNGFAFFRFP